MTSPRDPRHGSSRTAPATDRGLAETDPEEFWEDSLSRAADAIVAKLRKGGPGSGDWGHAGRPGEVGGSAGHGDGGGGIEFKRWSIAGAKGLKEPWSGPFMKENKQALVDFATGIAHSINNDGAGVAGFGYTKDIAAVMGYRGTWDPLHGIQLDAGVVEHIVAAARAGEVSTRDQMEAIKTLVHESTHGSMSLNVYGSYRDTGTMALEEATTEFVAASCAVKAAEALGLRVTDEVRGDLSARPVFAMSGGDVVPQRPTAYMSYVQRFGALVAAYEKIEPGTDERRVNGVVLREAAKVRRMDADERFRYLAGRLIGDDMPKDTRAAWALVAKTASAIRTTFATAGREAESRAHFEEMARGARVVAADTGSGK